MAQPWHNRITGYGAEPPDQLLANPRNWRTHPFSQTDALAGVLREVGVVQNVIVNQRTGYVVDGHARIALALRDGQPSIPVTYVDLSEDEEALILATLDPLSAMAGTDPAQLDALLRDVSTGEAAVQAMLAGLAEAAGILGAQPGAGGDEFDATPDDDGPTRCQPGDMWRIGGVHRLICGDSTDAATVARLMGGERARFEFTDPPYDLDTLGGGVLKNAAHMRDIRQAGIDNFDPSRLTMCAPTAVFCCNKPLVPAYIELARTLRVAWDLCFYAKKNTPPNYGGHMMTDVEYLMLLGKQSPISGQDKTLYSKAYFGELDADADVAWQKPVGLIEKFIHIFSEQGEIVIDRFLGSGTTLIAAHRTGRRCYGVELEPRYCDVILRRAEAEGLTVERADG